MKKSHIALIVIIAVSIGAIIATYGDASTYVDFKLAEANMGEKYTVIGQLDQEQPIEFNPKTIMLRFTAKDSSGERRTIYYNAPKPDQLERSEKITMTGFATDTGFVATDILMKCPSKYNEENHMMDTMEPQSAGI